jgi:hypothetical protein
VRYELNWYMACRRKAFQIPHVYDHITKLCTRQAEIIHNRENENARNAGQGETPHRKHKRLELGGGHLYDRSSVPAPAVVGASSN